MNPSTPFEYAAPIFSKTNKIFIHVWVDKGRTYVNQ